jgi:broad specificity phosphatase PhoE
MGACFDPSLEIYLSRHGQTEFNRENKFCGASDSPLTPLGIEEAHRNGRVLQEHLGTRADLRIVSSPLKRAVDTATIIRSELQRIELPIATDARLREIDFGAWEGLTLAEIKARDPAEWAKRVADRWHHAAPGGESYAAVAARVGDWLAGQRGLALVVTHGAVDRIVRGLYAGLAPDAICELAEPQDEIFVLERGRIAVL